MPTATPSKTSSRAAARRPPSDPVARYARDVGAGTIVAGPWVRLACARHLRDLEEGPARGLRFDVGLAQHAIDFFPTVLRLAEGIHAGQPFVLQPWQQFIVGSLFGWLGPDGFRRFRTAYIEAAKGAGKSPVCAGIGLYGLIADHEAGAEIYAAAVTRDQARIMFTDAQRMVDASAYLRRVVEKNVNNLAHHASGSFFRPVSSEARALDGKRVHMALIDEIHEHPTADVVDKMRAGTKGRRQAMIVEITNAGYDRHSVCWQHHEFSEKVVSGAVQNDSWFAYVCALDEGDDPFEDETCWIKASPNLGISVTEKYLREQVAEARSMPSKRNIVARLNFCCWTESSERWFAPEAWAAGGTTPVTPESFRGTRAVLGLDLSSTTDLSAAVLLRRDADGGYTALPHFWAPEESVRERVQRDRVPYDHWADEGYLTLTPGNVVDYAHIEAWIAALPAQLGVDVTEVAYDPWNATSLVTRLQEQRITCVPVRQGFASLTAASKELEKHVAAGTLRHGNHPVLRWCAANVVREQDPAGNIKPSKKKSTERIDGIVALVTALASAIVAGDGGSVYDERGVRWI